MMDFAERYGPWSVVAGASDGVGLEFARQLAYRGVNVVMLARRTAILQEAADSIRADTGTQTLAVSVDLTEADGVTAVKAATRGLEVGLFVYNAGADTLYKPFLETPIDTSLAMINRNCVVPTVLCHHFGAAMVQRGRGGIIIVSSASGEAGGPNAVIYGGTKAYDTVMAEGLWTELHEKGVDVLALILGATDTPSLRRLLVERGVLADMDDPRPIPRIVSSSQVAEEAIANLANGPTWFAGEPVRQGALALRSLSRNEAVKAMMANVAAGITREED